ncbi:hypothetical protein R3P38DRAFT_3594905 [Favolaschia claudopus]|uniref:Transmembrane protein n=1 Tax=Favolaschia claudopus TaxID=2862362 RepID=A0AAW0DKR3_9AGAR
MAFRTLQFTESVVYCNNHVQPQPSYRPSHPGRRRPSSSSFVSASTLEEGHSSSTRIASDEDVMTLESLSGRIDELERVINQVQPRPATASRTASKVKVTPWRLLNTFLVVLLGIYKAVSTYLDQHTAPTTLEWILGVLWATFLEDSTDLGTRERFFFTQDVFRILRPLTLYFIAPSVVVLVICGFIALMNSPSDPGSSLAHIQQAVEVVGYLLVYLAFAAFFGSACIGFNGLKLRRGRWNS